MTVKHLKKCILKKKPPERTHLMSKKAEKEIVK